MSRPRRLVLPGVPLHITQRGVDRRPIFHAPEDYGFFRWALAEASRKAGCAIHSYALMPNHVHLLLTPADATSAAQLMRAVGTRYVRFFNRRHGRTGTLWEGRFWSAIVDTTTYQLTCARYIELNSVRAGLAQRPEDFDWSSFRHNAFGRPDPIVRPSAAYVALGETPPQRRAAYQALFEAKLETSSIATLRSAQRGWSLVDTHDRRLASGVASDDASPWL